MTLKLSVRQLQDRLPELLDQLMQTGEEFVVQRDGKDFAVIVSAHQWRQRRIGNRLDALGLEYRLSPEKQAQVEKLLNARQRRALDPAERRQLKALMQECDAVLERRVAALDRGL